MPDARCLMQVPDREYQMLDTRYQMPDTRCQHANVKTRWVMPVVR